MVHYRIIPNNNRSYTNLDTRSINAKSFKLLSTVWTADTTEALRSCFDDTDWTVFIDSCGSLDELTETVTDYITFCENNVIETKNVKCFSNNKPWVDKELKLLLNAKKKAFSENNKEEIKSINKQIKSQTFRNKLKYKNKIENKLSSNDTKGAWEGFKTASGMKPKKVSISVPNEEEYSDDLNAFYSRFDKCDFRKECSILENVLINNDDQPLCFYEHDVRNAFNNVNPNKSKGPDNISGKVLKTCSNELAYIFAYIYIICL